MMQNRKSSTRLLTLSLLVTVMASGKVSATFRHPGLLHSQTDLERMREMVAQGREPWKSGFEVFRADPSSQADYRVRGPMEMVGRNPTVGQNVYDPDANAAYQCAIMWCVTGDVAYANKAKEIINAWSSTLTSITGRDAVLMAGLGPFKMVNAAEIIRYTDAGWSEAEIEQTKRHFKEVVYPVIKDFALFANGNWDIAAIQTVLAIGVFCSDEAIFERALRYYVNGGGDGRLTCYVINEAGQCQESGRDQQHTQLGLALLAACCEVAWQQGLDLYAYADYRLLKGFEYTAKYNLGEEVPFVETLDRTGKYHHERISSRGRGNLRAVYEMVYNHYVNRVGLEAPYTQKAAERVRPEGPGRPSADHPGFGTLLFSRAETQNIASVQPARQSHEDVRPTSRPAAPGGIIGKGSPSQIELTWVAAVGAEEYTVKRATAPEGALEIVAENVHAPAYVDADVQAGQVYYYTVCRVPVRASGGIASDDATTNGCSEDAYPAGVCAGLPQGWAQADVGNVAVAGSTEFDGQTFTVEAAGTDLGGTSDQLHLTYVPMSGDGVITARYVPQLSSQFTEFGLMMRESLDTDAAHASVLVTPQFGRNVEAPGWYARLMTRATAGVETIARDGERLDTPYVSNGRLLGHCWLRLGRQGDTFSVSVSTDGQAWIPVGATTAALKDDLLVGLGVCSGLATVTTVVKFDNVTVSTAPSDQRVVSPDGNVGIDFVLTDAGRPAYKVDYLGRPIVLESGLGFEPDFTDGFDLLGTSRDAHAGQWTNEFGERKIVPDNYQELNVDLKHSSERLLRLTFRAYNEGAALRYSFPEQDTGEFNFTGELTEFRLPEGTYGYEEHGTEGEYRRVRTGAIEPFCERPLTLEYSSGLYASLAEAANFAYPRMLLSPLPGVPGALVSALGGRTSNTERPNQRHDPSVTLSAGDVTPWRMFVVGRKPGDLLERNYLMLNLNPPCALEDTSWIKPGKVMRDTTRTTENSKAIIDFAQTGGLQYVHIDAGWYGSESSANGDATRPRVPNLDIQEIVRYGNEKRIGLTLYVDRRQIETQRDILFPLHEQWGVKGIKIGFIAVGPQEETAWTSETIAKAAEHQLMLNIHDGYRATGNNRTHPNLMTVEGIRGNEHMPTPEHNCTLPFTRYVAGIGDYTVCYYDRRIKTTHAHQLAMAVVSFSPLQWIFWYDRPSMYNGEPEVEFFRVVPTVWDDTKVVNGEIGKFATIARRHGDDWFIGTINNAEPRTLRIPLGFLAQGTRYTANIYYDDESVQTRTKVGIERRPVDSRTILDFPLVAGGGQAVWITPVQ
ncbi:MAG: glycoside hydrolase family 97 catalytic domain-containing protein [Sedimentisphaerales bacterium]|nr:glycoside hydrolase family 97 catalytic domain-containing protein [Sedimentisphaerales bacterium]